MKHSSIVIPAHLVFLLAFLLVLTGSSVHYEVAGTVANEQGDPLAERTVRLYNATDDLLDTAATDTGGHFTLSYEQQPTSSDPGDQAQGPAIPSEFKLGASYPNPFNPHTTVPFYSPENTPAVIGVYNILGQEILRTQSEMGRGINEIQVYLGGVSQGQYLLRVVGDGFAETGSMTFLSTGPSSGRTEIRVSSGGSTRMSMHSGDVAPPGGAEQSGGPAQKGGETRMSAGAEYRIMIEGDDTYLDKERLFQPYEQEVYDAGMFTLYYKEFQEGDGTLDNPYLVATPLQLDNVREHRQSHFRQIADIDLTGYADQEEGWEPIGSNVRRFRGAYDGDGFEITGLYINRPDSDYIGLFASLEDAEISNVRLSNVDITGRGHVGALAGRSERDEDHQGTIEDVYVSGSLFARSFYLGGILGAAYGEYITGCEVDVTLEGDFGNGLMNLGGMIGHLDGTITQSTSSGQIIANTGSVGGLIGRTSSDAFITNCSSSMTITSTSEDNARIGGLVGEHGGFSRGDGYISDSYATGDITSKGDRIGGLAGSVLAGKIINSHATGTVVSESDAIGGLVGNNYNGRISLSYATGDVEGGEETGGLIGRNRSPVESCHAKGNVSGTGRHVGGLIGINDQPPSRGEDPDITESYATGNVVGEADNVGGLIGQNRRGEVLRSYATGNVTGEADIVGGLIGLLMNGSVMQCYAHGDAAGLERVGGLVGDSRFRSVVESYSTGQVTGQVDIGGLIGADFGDDYERNYYDEETSGMNDVESALPLTTAQMHHQESFEGWNFDTVWIIEEGEGYPFQQWQQ